jgi:hypothetical protein
MDSSACARVASSTSGRFARVLQLGALGDQALEHLLAQAGGGRRHHAALAHLAQGARHAARTSLLVMGSVLTTATM